MNKTSKKQLISSQLNAMFPDAKCELSYSSPYQLLVAVILSAQCTDKRVNMVTKELFKRYDTPEKILTLSQSQLEEKIHSCGFYHNKAAAILSMSKDIITKFNGVVPNDFDDLCSLAGVGRKTANVIISEAFKGDGFAVDTHVLRIANRLQLVSEKNPNKVEMQLKSYFDQSDWSRLHYQMVLFGRYKCKAQNPDCKDCPFEKICKKEYKK